MVDCVTESLSSMATSDAASTRRPYHGSCHCGHTKYVAFLTLPPITSANTPPSSGVRIYKCNCSTCHKMGLFHVRLVSSPDDFVLLSPLDPETGGLGDYTCFSGRIHWYFCKQCGVRCFGFWGTGETAEVDEGSWRSESSEGGGGKTVKVWRPKKEGWIERSGEPGRNSYLTVNALTLEPGQEGFDLKEWTEKKWIWYLDDKTDKGEDRVGEPHEGGMY